MVEKWNKAENRYYRVMDHDGVDYVEKATYNLDDEKYVPCGEWTVEIFLAHAETFDGNTEDNYDTICTTLGI